MRWSWGQRAEKTERNLREAKRLLKRVAVIDAELAKIEKQGAAIKKHCTATADEIRAEAANHAKQMRDKRVFELGLKLMTWNQRDMFKRGKLQMPD